MRRTVRICLATSLYFLLQGGAQAASGTASDRKPEPFDRGIDTPNSLFIPKGTWAGGFTFSYNTLEAGQGDGDSGYSLLSSMLSGIRGTFHTFSVAPAVSYFINNNISVGLRFDYANTKLGLGNADLSISDDLGFTISDWDYRRQSYLGSVTLRGYMPIEKSRRFALFVEGRFTGGYAQSQTSHLEDGLRHGTYQDIYKASIGVVPGITVFITNEVSFEVQIGVMGLNYQLTKQNENRVQTSTMTSSGANFRINLLSIGFGTTFHFMDRWHRPSAVSKRQ